jgi:hypothetical protein
MNAKLYGPTKKSRAPPEGDNTIVIPELEEAMKTYKPHGSWSDEDVRAIKTYYGKVPTSLLATTIHHTVDSIHKYAETHGIKANRQ